MRLIFYKMNQLPNKQEVLEAWKAMEGRIMRKIKRRMRILAKDKKLKEQMEKEIHETLSKQTKP